MKTRKTAAAFAFLMGVGFAADALAGSAIGPSERQQQEVRRNQNRQAPVTVAQRSDNRDDDRNNRREARPQQRQENRGQRTENRQSEPRPQIERPQGRPGTQPLRPQIPQTQRQDNRQDFRQERRDDRQDYRQDRRDDRGDYRADRRDDRRDYAQRQQQWTRNHNWSSYRRPSYRNDRDWRDYQGVRRGYYYAPGYGYYRPPAQYYGHRWNRGQRLPSYYYSYRVYDPYYYDLPAAPYGYEYVYSGSDIILVALTTGIILDVFFDIF
jgi:Ni/Co efflux regulator RcnB